MPTAPASSCRRSRLILNNWLNVFQPADIAPYQQRRDGETRLGECIRFVDAAAPWPQALLQAKSSGCRYVLLGIPEDIGPRANLGNGGADAGFTALLSKLVNLQANQLIEPTQLLLLGQVHCSDLQQACVGLDAARPADLAQLRQHCAELDRRVTAVLTPVFAAGLIPLVIGGGHNNALPILQAASQHAGQPLQAINLDPHCDFRLLEGRHSGNGFSYAHQAGWLQHYFVVGLHELKNSAKALAQLQAAGAGYVSYQQIWQRRELSFAEAVEQAIRHISAGLANGVGIELDTDSISGMPVSAYTNCGLSVADAEYFVWRLAQLPQSRYLHLAEAAPSQHPAGLKAGMNEAGQILTALVIAFLQSHQQQLA